MSWTAPWSSQPPPLSPMPSTLSPPSLGAPPSPSTMFGGMTGYGFEVPQGNPGEIEAAARGVKRVGGAFTMQAQSIRVAAQTALEADGGWRGSASGMFTEYVGRLIRTLSANGEVCDAAAGALSQLSQALSHAQAVTRQALADCVTYNDAHTKAMSDVHTATVAHQTAVQNYNAAPDPVTRTSYNLQVTKTQTDLSTAQTAERDAANNLNDAKTKGQNAYNAYMQESSALAGRVTAASHALHTMQAPAGGAPAPLNVTPSDVSLASMLTAMAVSGKLKGPLIDAVPASERTPGLIYSLLQDQRKLQEEEFHGGGARGPYYMWGSEYLGRDAGSANQAVNAGVFPPMPSNWGSMTLGQREQYLWSVHSLFPDVSCPSSATCNFSMVTGTGTRPIPRVLSYIVMAPINVTEWAVKHPGQAAEYTAAGVCTVSGDVPCVVAVGGAFGADTAVNYADAGGVNGDFWRHEGVTAATTVIMGGPGLVKGGLGAAGLFETPDGVSALPDTTLGKAAVNLPPAATGAAGTALGPTIEHRVIPPSPAPPPAHHHHGHK
jgi:hypothetical protein